MMRSSDSHPIRVDFVDQDTLGLQGSLGMTFAPGMKADSYNGRWERDLNADLQRLNEIGALLVFDWGEWRDEVERLFNDPSALASADEVTLRKLLHFHARRDHFAQDHFAEMLRSGHTNSILCRLKELYS